MNQDVEVFGGRSLSLSPYRHKLQEVPNPEGQLGFHPWDAGGDVTHRVA